MLMSNAMALVERCENLGRMIEETARRHPRRRAIILEKGVWSYRSLNAIANRYAHAFRKKLGVSPSDRIAILLSNDIHYIFACLGAFKAGAAVVPLNCFLTAPELKFILADSASTVLVTSDQFAPIVRKFSDELPALKALVTVGREDLGNETWLCDELIKGMGDSDPGLEVKQSDLAVIIYTSGTTGKPKGAMLTHGNLLSNIAGSGTSIGIDKRDRILLMLPMFHSFTLTACILMPLSVGAGIVPVGKLRSVPRVIRSMALKRATILIGIPHIYDVIAQQGIPWWLRMLLGLRMCISGSAPLSETTLKRFEEKVGIPLLEGYGLSETSPVVSINPLQGPRKPGSVGKPIPGVEVKIVSGEGVELPSGRIGEIAVKGPNVMRGYLNHPRETKETIRAGWLLTGDIGKIDDDGYIYILDRKKEMILFHGMNVYPREIEEILFTHQAVAEAAVVGKPDPHRGEVPVAFVSLKEGERIEAPALIRHCRRFLAGYKVPHRIIIAEKLPRTATGKILKRELKQAVTRHA